MGSGRSRIDHKNVPPTARQMPSLSYDVLCLPIVTEWGPLGATVITSFDDAKEKLGDYLANYLGMVHLKRFFDGGGRRAITSRIMHWDANGQPATAAKSSATAQTGSGSPTYGTATGTEAAPFSLANGDTIIVKVDLGSEETATFEATAASIETGLDEPFALWDGATLQLAIDGGATQLITFSDADFADIGTATAEEVAAAINKELLGASAAVVNTSRVTVTSDTKGTGSSVNLVESGGGAYGSDANSVLTFPVDTATGTGDAVNAASVTLAELKTWLENDPGITSPITVSYSGSYATISTDTAGPSGAIQVVDTSTADTKIGWDNTIHYGTAGGAADTLGLEGLYYGTLQLGYDIEDATNGDAAKFDLKIYRKGVLWETFRSVTMDETDTYNYVVNVVNTLASRSGLVRASDEGAGGTPAQRRPANTVSTVTLTGGDDGLTGLATADYVGVSTHQTGLYAFNTVREGDLLICPDDTSVTAQNACIAFCQDVKKWKMVFIPEVPFSSDKEAAAAHEGNLSLSEARARALWPWIKIPNPDKNVYGQTDTITVSPTSSWCGRMAKNSQEDPEKQMWVQPGNEHFGLLDGACGLETDEVLEPDVQDYVTDAGVNPVLAGTRWEDNRYGVWVHDVMAGKRELGLFKSLGPLRGVAHLRKKFEAYLERERVQNMTQEWRTRIQKAFERECKVWCAAGVLASKNASEAFYINADPVGEGLNNPLIQKQEKFRILVALNWAEAGRFMEIWITKDERGVESWIQQKMAATSVV